MLLGSVDFNNEPRVTYYRATTGASIDNSVLFIFTEFDERNHLGVKSGFLELG